MRKLVNLFVTVLISSTFITTVVACANPFFNSNIIRITVVTDGHTIDDNSFNQSAYQGALQFKSQFESLSERSLLPKAELNNKKIEVLYDQPKTIELNNLLQSYGRAVVMNSKVTLAAGFVQRDALIKAQNELLKNSSMRYVYIDGDTPNNVVPKENKNLLGLLYKAEQSGFLAGIAAMIWLAANNEKYGGSDNLNVSTYGGADIPAVTNYMLGFYWSVGLFNKIKILSPTLYQKFLDWIVLLGGKKLDSLPKINFIKIKDQFTGTFDQATNASKGLNNELITKNANVIFPVAGPQTSDTIGAIANSKAKTKAKIVGVDTDQQTQYPQSADLFLTSALKNITKSVSTALWTALGYDFDNKVLIADTEVDATFKKDAQPKGGDFIGIANNKAINPIYENLINDKEILEYSKKVSVSWEKISNLSNNYWSEGLNIDPFNKEGEK